MPNDRDYIITSLMNSNQVKRENKNLLINVSADIKTIMSDVKYLRSEIEELKKKINQLNVEGTSGDEPIVVEKSTGWFY